MTHAGVLLIVGSGAACGASPVTGRADLQRGLAGSIRLLGACTALQSAHKDERGSGDRARNPVLTLFA